MEFSVKGNSIETIFYIYQQDYIHTKSTEQARNIYQSHETELQHAYKMIVAFILED